MILLNLVMQSPRLLIKTTSTGHPSRCLYRWSTVEGDPPQISRKAHKTAQPSVLRSREGPQRFDFLCPEPVCAFHEYVLPSQQARFLKGPQSCESRIEQYLSLYLSSDDSLGHYADLCLYSSTGTTSSQHFPTSFSPFSGVSHSIVPPHYRSTQMVLVPSPAFFICLLLLVVFGFFLCRLYTVRKLHAYVPSLLHFW